LDRGRSDPGRARDRPCLSKYDFVINLKAAKALGLIIPSALVVTADEVIE
jgi:hypothetical protein